MLLWCLMLISADTACINQILPPCAIQYAGIPLNAASRCRDGKTGFPFAARYIHTYTLTLGWEAGWDGEVSKERESLVSWLPTSADACCSVSCSARLKKSWVGAARLPLPSVRNDGERKREGGEDETRMVSGFILHAYPVNVCACMVECMSVRVRGGGWEKERARETEAVCKCERVYWDNARE